MKVLVVIETIQELQQTVELDATNLEAKNKLWQLLSLIEPPQIQDAEN